MNQKRLRQQLLSSLMKSQSNQVIQAMAKMNRNENTNTFDKHLLSNDLIVS